MFNHDLYKKLQGYTAKHFFAAKRNAMNNCHWKNCNTKQCLYSQYTAIDLIRIIFYIHII